MALDRAKLKIKEKSLAAEQTMIRLEEKKHKWRMRALRAKMKPATTNTSDLYHHRKNLRKEIRSSHIANSFLRGRTYQEIENFSFTQPDWNRIQRLVEKYSGEEPQVALQRLSQWMDDALRGVKPYLVDRDTRTPNSGRDLDWIKMQNERDAA